MAQPEAGAAIERARRLVGARFRPQGRSVALGLDCVGVAALAFELSSARVRSDYSLRGGRPGTIEAELARFFDRTLPENARAGDLLLVSPGHGQLHLLLSTGTGYIHADARLRCVAEVPGSVPWPILSAWRFSQAGQRERG